MRSSNTYAACDVVETTANAYPAAELIINNAEGVWISATDGKTYLDGCGGTFNIGLGYRHPSVTQALSDVIKSGILHGSGTLGTKTILDAENALVSIAPEGIDKCHMKGCTGGSTAIEQAIRHAWATTGRDGILSFKKSHHGQTIVSTLVSGMDYRKKRIRIDFSGATQLPAPDCYWCQYTRHPIKTRPIYKTPNQNQTRLSSYHLNGRVGVLLYC